jgi:diacylglycerol kinase family enzyme
VAGVRLGLADGVAAFSLLSVRLKINGEEHLRRTPFVFIGNNEYLQGLTLGARERLDTGKLCLYVAQKPTRLGLLRYAVHALFGRLQEARDFDVLSAPSLDIETRHQRLRVATDGEVTLMSPPLCYRSRAAALNVIVPPSLGGSMRTIVHLSDLHLAGSIRICCGRCSSW